MNDVVSPVSEALVIEGRIDALRAPQLDAELLSLFESGLRHVVLDLGQVSYMSSSGLRVLLLAQRRQQRVDGSLVLLNPPPRVYRVLQMAGLDRVFIVRITASESAASAIHS